MANECDCCGEKDVEVQWFDMGGFKEPGEPGSSGNFCVFCCNFLGMGSETARNLAVMGHILLRAIRKEDAR